MKNVQIIDGAINSAYDIYACTEDEYRFIFPDEGQDIEFIEDMVSRLGKKAAGDILGPVWTRPIRKPDVVGIHGTLFYELRKTKREFYPNKRESDLDSSGRGWKQG